MHVSGSFDGIGFWAEAEHHQVLAKKGNESWKEDVGADYHCHRGVVDDSQQNLQLE